MQGAPLNFTKSKTWRYGDTLSQVQSEDDRTYLRGPSLGAIDYDLAPVRDNGIIGVSLDSVTAGFEIASRHDEKDMSVGSEGIPDSTDRPFISRVGASMSEWNTWISYGPNWG